MTRVGDLSINRDAEGPFARWATKTWLKVTDDHPIPDELGDAPEVYYRMGLLNGLQAVICAARNPDCDAGQEVRAALVVAGEIMDETL